MRNYTFKHNARSYFDIYGPLVQAYPTAPNWMFKEMAGLFDFQSELQNRIALDIMHPSTRESAYAFAAQCDYSPRENTGSSVDLTITLGEAIEHIIYKGHQFSGVSSASGEYIIFEAKEDTSSEGAEVFTVGATQMEAEANVEVGTVENTKAYQEYPLEGVENLVKSTITLKINEEPWIRVDDFDTSQPLDKHFVVIYQSSGKARILFGDGITGKIPTLNDIIYANFSTTDGLAGNLKAGEINTDELGDPMIQEVSNLTAATGGDNAESISSIIRNSRANARLRNAVWSKEDVETAAKKAPASTSIVKAYTVTAIGSASIQIIPSGGGNPSTTDKTDIAEYVKSLTVFGSVPITCMDPVYSPVDIEGTVSIREGFDGTIVRNLVKFALTLLTSAYDSQVIEAYIDKGINRCREETINVLWSWNFTEEENKALEFIILKWGDLLGNREHREWGQLLEVGNIWVMVNSLYPYGIDVFSLTSPVANINIPETEIISTGTITVS